MNACNPPSLQTTPLILRTELFGGRVVPISMIRGGLL